MTSSDDKDEGVVIVKENIVGSLLASVKSNQLSRYKIGTLVALIRNLISEELPLINDASRAFHAIKT